MEIDYSSDLLTYVCYCDYERLEKLIYSDDFKEKYDRKLINLALDVSICSAIAWTDRGWCDSVIHIFNEFGEKSLKCIDVWKKYLGKERLKKPNYHKKYSRMMYCHDDFGVPFQGCFLNCRRGCPCYSSSGRSRCSRVLRLYSACRSCGNACRTGRR